MVVFCCCCGVLGLLVLVGLLFWLVRLRIFGFCGFFFVLLDALPCGVRGIVFCVLFLVPCLWLFVVCAGVFIWFGVGVVVVGGFGCVRL